ncbi:hypothetical protein BSLG_001962 [Batrachochytrium salamandrivorans]|nr:hypothetical protein BSLG_001962 [Batrachochytrium salamandrivorans]
MTFLFRRRMFGSGGAPAFAPGPATIVSIWCSTSQPQTSGFLGATANAGGEDLTAQAKPPAFAAPASTMGTSLFGSAAPPTSQFGAPPATGLSGSLFGNASTASAPGGMGGSLFGQAKPALTGFGLRLLPLVASLVKPNLPPAFGIVLVYLVNSQLLPLVTYSFYFYNMVHQSRRIYTSHHPLKLALIQQAQLNNPDQHVLAVGFGDLKSGWRFRSDSRQFHKEKLELTLFRADEALRSRLEAMERDLQKPSIFRGRLNEIWAQLQQLKDSKRMSEDATFSVVNEEALTPVLEALSEMQNGLGQFTKLIQSDQRNLEVMTQAYSETPYLR